MNAKNPLRNGLIDDKTGEACALVIFGASGDLTRRKLVPALYNLAVSRALPGAFAIVGVARRPKTDDAFRAEMKEGTAKFSRRKPLDEAVWSDFEKGITYVQGTFEDPKTYANMRKHLEALDKERGTQGNRLYYFAVPPSDFGIIVDGLREAKLVRTGEEKEGGPWTRVVFEKPFGHDLKSAVELNDTIARVFKENEVFRIDHYLGKETVQNLLVFR
jgi:glucose-6-phosphate 1-dehydrogenase